MKSRDYPLLVQLAEPRRPGPSIPGRYCPVVQMWVVEDDQGRERPLIEVAASATELVTKTLVQIEQDDTNEIGLLEITTKTRVQVETDDIATWAAATLALTTKTEADDERDRQDPDIFGTALLDLVTKTDAQLERDDVTYTSGVIEDVTPALH